jgi:hypothetical protein
MIDIPDDLAAERPHAETELSADQRAGAAALRAMYVAQRQAGFSEFQSLVLLGVFLATAGRGNS